MISKNDMLQAIRAVVTVIVSLFTIALIGIITTPFLGDAYSYHKMLEESGTTVFISIRLVMLAIILVISFSLLYATGRICKKKTGTYTYVVLFMISLALCLWRCYDFVSENFWNYVPFE